MDRTDISWRISKNSSLILKYMQKIWFILLSDEIIENHIITKINGPSENVNRFLSITYSIHFTYTDRIRDFLMKDWHIWLMVFFLIMMFEWWFFHWQQITWPPYISLEVFMQKKNIPFLVSNMLHVSLGTYKQIKLVSEKMLEKNCNTVSE